MRQERPPLLRMQRSHGAARVTLSAASGATRLGRLHQSGSAKALLPAVHSGDGVPELVFLNTSGGLTGGDSLAFELELGPGARAVATTQTAERAYASAAGAAEVSVRLSAGAGARLDWLPQETILFDAAALRRCTILELDRDACGVLAEILVLGRAASGEVVRRLALRDTRLVRREGRMVLLEPLLLDGAMLARSDNPALLGGARAMATVAFVGPNAADVLCTVRAALTQEGVEAAASGWGDKCLVRVLGGDALPVRRQVARVIEALTRRPLPRVWQI